VDVDEREKRIARGLRASNRIAIPFWAGKVPSTVCLASAMFCNRSGRVGMVITRPYGEIGYTWIGIRAELQLRASHSAG